MRALGSMPQGADDTCARNVPCVGDGSPALRHAGMCRGEARASQLTGPSSSYGPWSNTPPETPPSLPRRYVCRGVLWPSGKTGPSASGKTIGFGAACPMAHTFARLRIADHISGIVARLATGSGGLTLGRAGRVLHPLDDKRSFMKLSHLHSPSTGIAWSHYFPYTPIPESAPVSG